MREKENMKTNSELSIRNLCESLRNIKDIKTDETMENGVYFVIYFYIGVNQEAMVNYKQ